MGADIEATALEVERPFADRYDGERDRWVVEKVAGEPAGAWGSEVASASTPFWAEQIALALNAWWQEVPS